MAKLTKRQTEILSLIETHLKTTGSPPTRAEIAKTMGFKSPNAAEDHLRALARKGVIELMPSTSRGIRVIQHTGIPLIAHAAFGQPILSEQNVQQMCQVDAQLFQPKIDFLKRANTTQFKSMGILENDYLAVHKLNHTKELRVGQFVIVREGALLNMQHLGSHSDIEKIHSLEGVVVGVIRPLSTSNLT